MSALCEAPAEAGRLEWQEKNVFVVPSWYWHAHSNERAEPATLFESSDEIIYQALGLDGERGQGDLIIVLRD